LKISNDLVEMFIFKKNGGNLIICLHRFKITTGLCLLKNPPTFGPNPLLFKAKSPYLGGWKYGMYGT
jgi:hypothetical protein